MNVTLQFFKVQCRSHWQRHFNFLNFTVVVSDCDIVDVYADVGRTH